MASQRSVFLTALASLLFFALAACNSNPGDPKEGITLSKVAGDKVTAAVGTGTVLTVRVERDGAPEAAVPVLFEAVSGGGKVSHEEVRTDENGVASTLWLLGTETGEQVARATVAGVTVDFTAQATALQVGSTYFGRNDYVEFIPGELPVILSSPHDGPLTPSEIPDRTWGTVARDLNTMDLTRRISNALHTLTGKRPTVAIMHLRRIKIDPNRDIVEAAQGNVYSEWAWHQYHTWIDIARESIVQEYGTGILFDIHGQGHDIKRIELGYQLNASDLNRTDAQLDGANYINKSSIRHIGANSKLSFSQVIRGDDSLGEIMARNGIRAIPSKSEPMPLGDPFLCCGYTLVRHGSRDGGTFNAIMLEHDTGTRSNGNTRAVYANALAKTIVEYVAKHLGIEMAELQAAQVP